MVRGAQRAACGAWCMVRSVLEELDQKVRAQCGARRAGGAGAKGAWEEQTRQKTRGLLNMSYLFGMHRPEC